MLLILLNNLLKQIFDNILIKLKVKRVSFSQRKIEIVIKLELSIYI